MKNNNIRTNTEEVTFHEFGSFYVKVHKNFKKRFIPKDVIDIKEWCEALRSGDYKKTCGMLATASILVDKKEEISYCCLGVLAKTKKLPIASDFSFLKKLTHREHRSITSYIGDTGSIISDSGLFFVVSLPEEKLIESLSDLNDFHASFEQIAQVIELFFTNDYKQPSINFEKATLS